MAPTFAYDTIGRGYSAQRRPDPRIAARIEARLGDCDSLLNVGAGSGSYEPVGRTSAAVEPSMVMIAQRSAQLAPAFQATAQHLPFLSDSFDASMAVLTMHHWPDWRSGAREMRRVARRRVVVLTWDPECEPFWLYRDYFPDLAAVDRAIFPPVAALCTELGGATAHALPVPHDCSDGFLGAFWRRPHAYLDPAVRAAMSTIVKIDDVEPRIARLAQDLESGAWAARNASILERDESDIGYRLVVADRSITSQSDTSA